MHRVSRVPTVVVPWVVREATPKLSNVTRASPVANFVEELACIDSSRAHFVKDVSSGALVSSAPSLQPLADELKATSDYHGHEALFFAVGDRSGALMSAFISGTVRGQGSGGLRMRQYDSVGDIMADGMRLSLGMERKNALAGLWWGGGKGILVPPPTLDVHDDAVRRNIFTDYGEFVASLQGAYITAEDSGVSVSDIDVVHGVNRYTTCISPALGGSGNPSACTAGGVVVAMEAALEAEGRSLSGVSVAVQGVGNVGGPLVRMLLDRNVGRVVASDSVASRVEAAKEEFGDRVEVSLVPAGDNSVLFEDVDIAAPCAFGGVLNDDTIPRIKARIVCGAANNQLAQVHHAEALTAAGKVYVPDFLANRMGIVQCANEQYGRVGSLGSLEDPLIRSHLTRDSPDGIFQVTQRVLKYAAEKGVTTDQAARDLADAKAAEPHPIFGHRTAEVVKSLVASGWATGKAL